MSLFLVLTIGLIVGSFLNVLIYRLPRGESIVLPPSHCPNCHHRLAVGDLFPVLSYLWLKGRCRYCGTRVSLRYPLVELLTGGLTLAWWFRYGLTPEGMAILFLTYGLIAIAFIDLDHQIIPNKLTLPLMVLGLFYHVLSGELLEALLGGLAGGGVLLAIALAYPKGMGMGDVKFLAMAGVFLGWYRALLILFIGSLLGTLVIFPLLLLKKADRKTPFAFGPFLVLATWIIIYLKDWLGVLSL